jgi:peptidoglycan/LPS O-acetylase OafA/YrhL
MVIGYHMQDLIWVGFPGDVGVTVFFLLSGFLITTLLLREESCEGRVYLKGFYLRRIFRILPLYYLAFLVYTLLIFGLRMGGEADQFARNFPYYLLYQNDFAPGGPFGHTWSLAIEEKYYLIWPALGFAGVAILRKCRVWILAALLCITLVMEYTPLHYLAIYVPLIFGSLVACAMHNPTGFVWMSRLAHPAYCIGLLIAACVGVALSHGAPRTHTLFAVIFSLTIPGIEDNRK